MYEYKVLQRGFMHDRLYKPTEVLLNKTKFKKCPSWLLFVGTKKPQRPATKRKPAAKKKSTAPAANKMQKKVKNINQVDMNPKDDLEVI